MIIFDIIGFIITIINCIIITELLYISRFITGFVSSILTTCISVYTSELVPKDKIGVFASIYHIFLPIGFTICFVFGIFLPSD